jgi:hypothetical protein
LTLRLRFRPGRSPLYAELKSALVARGDEPESLAGLVQALRSCDHLDASVAAHDRAIGLDPALMSSVAHTHFLRGDYQRALDLRGNAVLPRRRRVGGARRREPRNETAA